ncbi:MAG: hypothetical protein ACPGVB_05570 [Chitinophagales bacterium]
MNPIFRNSLISGTLIVLAFLALFLLRPEEGSRNMDNIGSPGTTMLFVLGMILPGFLFGLALSLAMPDVTQNKRVIFTLLSGFLYMGLVFGSIARGSTSTLPIVIASGIGGLVIMLLVHFLLYPLPLLQSLGVGTVIGLIAAIPFFMMFQSPEEAKSIGKIAGIIGLGIYLYWQAGIGFYLSKVIENV